MPIYEFECPECGPQELILSRQDVSKKWRCPRCRARMSRVFSAPALHFRSPGFTSVEARAEKGIRGKGSSLHRTGKYAP